ncbi:hypothetical protein phiG2_03 [Lysinibacillus phage phiG2]|nr:hypothetical protein phiG2_03 [Lysinibacillus phage phiG2]
MKQVITYTSRRNNDLKQNDVIVHNGKCFQIERVLMAYEWKHGFSYIIIVSLLSEETFLFQKSYYKMLGWDFFSYSHLYPVLSMKVRDDLEKKVSNMFNNLVVGVN